MSENNENISKYTRLVPGEIRRALKSLAEDREIAILVLLIKEERLAFSEIKDELKLHQQKLSTSLKRMQNGGIVVRKDVMDDGSTYRTKYQVTEYGKKVLDKLFEAIEPQQEQRVVMFYQKDIGKERSASEFYQDVETKNKTKAVKSGMQDARMVGGPSNYKEPNSPREATS